MTADERYNLICVKIERAKEHILNLETELRAFFDTDPYVVWAKRDPETSELIYYLIRVSKTPPRLSVIAGDVLHSLRGALDHLAYHLIEVGGGRPTRQSSFPITNTADPTEYKANRTRKVQGMRQDAIDAIDALKPYKGGNDSLWILSELNNIDKHRLIITMGGRYGTIDLSSLLSDTSWVDVRLLDDAGEVNLVLSPIDAAFPLYPGYELFRDIPGAKVNEDLKFSFDVALSESQVLEGEPLIETLHSLAELVSNIVADFKPLLI